jgi:hypothetical protein
MTIFDYDVTEQELSLLYIDCSSKEDYLRKTSPKKILQDLYVLFRMREDLVRAGSIRQKLFDKVA